MQGKPILPGEDFEKVIVIPTGSQSFGLDTPLEAGLLREQIQGEVADEPQILGAMPGCENYLLAKARRESKVGSS